MPRLALHPQAKLGGMCVDVLRMVRALDRRAGPLGVPAPTGRAVPRADEGPDDVHKTMLHRPSVTELIQNLAPAAQSAQGNSALLLYLSAPVCEYWPSNEAQMPPQPAVQLSPRSSLVSKGLEPDAVASPESLLTSTDLIPFQRVPFIVVIDGEGGDAFDLIQGMFQSSTLVLRSGAPEQAPHWERPDGCGEDGYGQRTGGRSLTHFLLDPVLALCALRGTSTIHTGTVARAQEVVRRCFEAVTADFFKAQSIDQDPGALTWRSFFGDELTANFILRFLLCRAALRGAMDEDALPSASPDIPEALVDNAAIEKLLRDLVNVIDGADESRRDEADSEAEDEDGNSHAEE